MIIYFFSDVYLLYYILTNSNILQIQRNGVVSIFLFVIMCYFIFDNIEYLI